MNELLAPIFDEHDIPMGLRGDLTDYVAGPAGLTAELRGIPGLRDCVLECLEAISDRFIRECGAAC